MSRNTEERDFQAEVATISFDVPGPVAGKARPRVTRSGGHTYTPDPKAYAARVAEYGVVARNEMGAEITDGPVYIYVEIYRPLPKSWSQRKRDRMLLEPCLTTPDGVNVLANVCDALEGVFYHNDRQVFDCRVVKTWSLSEGTGIRVDQIREGRDGTSIQV